MESTCKKHQAVSWIFRLLAAAILLETLFFKFTGAEESVYIFTKVGAEPWGRIGSGIAELIAAILLLTPKFVWAGALLAMGIMGGAILAHLTVLGIEVKDDGGLLFGLAVTVFLASAFTAYLHRQTIPVLSRYLNPQHS